VPSAQKTTSANTCTLNIASIVYFDLAVHFKAIFMIDSVMNAHDENHAKFSKIYMKLQEFKFF